MKLVYALIFATLMIIAIAFVASRRDAVAPVPDAPVVSTPAPAPVPAAPAAPVVTKPVPQAPKTVTPAPKPAKPWCEGAYSPDKGTNFGDCK